MQRSQRLKGRDNRINLTEEEFDAMEKLDQACTTLQEAELQKIRDEIEKKRSRLKGKEAGGREDV